VGYDAVSLGNCFPAFRRKLSPSFDVCLSVHRCISVEKKTN